MLDRLVQENASPHALGQTWEDVAASSYRAYAASTGNKNFRGEPMPEWDALPKTIQLAWSCAVRQAFECYLSGPDAYEYEQAWYEWTQEKLKEKLKEHK